MSFTISNKIAAGSVSELQELVSDWLSTTTMYLGTFEDSSVQTVIKFSANIEMTQLPSEEQLSTWMNRPPSM